MGDKYIKAIPSFPDITGKEDKSNKVQNLNSPNSTTYPSTNAVKNALDSKVESVTGTGVDNTDPINPIINIDKHTIGLGNVDNIQQIPLTDKGAINGVAELDSTGKVPVSQLPSYVSDVETYPSLSSFPTTGVDNLIYIAEDTNLTYRWTGATYVEISPSIALGETSSTAYRGDRGKIAYDHSQLTSGNPHNVNKGDVGLGNVDNMKQINADAGGSTTQDPNNPSHPVILTDHINSPGQGTHWYIQTMEHSSSGSKTQIARQYGFSGNDDATYTRRYYNYNNTNHWTPWKRLVTEDEIDADVDRLPLILGRESINDLPLYYQNTYPDSMVQEKKSVSTVGATSLIPNGSSLSVVTYIGTSSSSVYQVATSSSSNKQIKRFGDAISNAWGPWEELITGKENTSNKVNNLNSPNTWEYPTTAAVQNAINSIQSPGTIHYKARVYTVDNTAGNLQIVPYINPHNLNITITNVGGSYNNFNINGFNGIPGGGIKTMATDKFEINFNVPAGGNVFSEDTVPDQFESTNKSWKLSIVNSNTLNLKTFGGPNSNGVNIFPVGKYIVTLTITEY